MQFQHLRFFTGPGPYSFWRGTDGVPNGGANLSHGFQTLFWHKNRSPGGIFGRKTIEDDIRNDLGKVNKNKKLVLKKLDTYSIGILLMHFGIMNTHYYTTLLFIVI